MTGVRSWRPPSWRRFPRSSSSSSRSATSRPAPPPGPSSEVSVGTPPQQRGPDMTEEKPSGVRVAVWGENRHEKTEEHVAKIYPQGMHTAIADGIRENL